MSLKKQLPAIALRGTTILPGMIVHFDVSRERSVKAIENAMLGDERVFLVTQKDADIEAPDLSQVYRMGTIALIKQVVKLPHNLVRVLVEGRERAELDRFLYMDPYLYAEVALVEEEESEDYVPALADAMKRTLRELFHHYSKESGKISKELVSQILNIEDLKEDFEQAIKKI